MKKETYINIFLLICSFLICLVVGEAVVRRFGYYDSVGNFFFPKTGFFSFQFRLKPYILPADNVKKVIDEYLSSSTSYIMYDPILGWTNRPNSTSYNGYCRSNPDGLRTHDVDYLISRVPQRGVLRIAIFGDSFTHGSGVIYENSWGYYLEDNLKKSGINTEILNFGVEGYGMGQAFLRWKKIGYKFSPHIVILGFSAENMWRNVNLIRPALYAETGIPFSKPRYILEGNKLKLINSPTAQLYNIVSIMRDMESWKLSKYEYWFNPEDYHRKLWHMSKFISLILDSFSTIKRKLDCYSLSREPARVTLKIVEEFKKDVESKGAKFYIVHLPGREHLGRILRIPWYKLPYSELFERLKEIVYVIDPVDRMLINVKSSGLDSVFGNHYTPAGNRIIADQITKFITKQQKNNL